MPPASTLPTRYEQQRRVLRQLSDHLDTDLDDTALEAIVDLLEAGVTQTAVVAIVEQLDRERSQQQRRGR